MELPAADLARLSVEMTLVGGQVVYERGRPAAFTGIPDTI
jgi:hypothetical protein